LPLFFEVGIQLYLHGCCRRLSNQFNVVALSSNAVQIDVILSRRFVRAIAVLLDRLSEDDVVSCVDVKKESEKDDKESSRSMLLLVARVRLLDFLDIFLFFALQDSTTCMPLVLLLGLRVGEVTMF
jgi:hypothetical protein